MIPRSSQNPDPSKRDRSPLLVWQWPTETGETALIRLHGLANENDIPLLVYDRINAAAAALQASPDSMLLLVVPTARQSLATGMMSGRMPSDLLSDWKSRIRELLDLRRIDRRRCLMITPEVAMSCSADLCARLGVQPLPEVSTPPLPDCDPVLDLLAQQAIDSDVEARNFARELSASLLRLDQEATAPALDATLRHYLKSEDIEELTEQLMAAQKEAETQYQRAEKLVDLEAERDAALAETEIFLTQLKTFQETADHAEARMREMETEHAAVVADKNAKLQKLSERKKKSEAECDVLRHQLEQLEQQKHQLAQGLESHQALLQDAESKRHALREQLAQMHEVHAELESHFARAEALEDTLADREEALAAAKSSAAQFERQSSRLEKRIAMLDQSLVAQQAQIAEREARLAALDDRLGRIQRSPGYRMTAPLRALFGGSSRDA